MSKKDRQHQQPLAPQLLNQPDASSEPDSREAEIRSLRADLERVTANYETLLTHHKNDIEMISKAARHGAPTEGFEPKTAEGKEALEQVVLLGNVAKEQRHRADELQLSVDESAKALGSAIQNHYQLPDVARGAAETRKALRSDLMVLEQTAAGRAPGIALQTDLGKSAAHALSEVLTMLDKVNEDNLQGDALPANGWSSATARQLVEAVGPQPGLRASDVRSLLLGDLLAQLLPHTGETGQNETASDVLKRTLAERRKLTDLTAEVERIQAELESRLTAQSERMVKIQSAMVARRAPDAEWLGVRDQIAMYLKTAGQDVGSFGIVRCTEAMANELRGLRSFFSEAPLTAVAVRDDGAKGPVRERYSLLVLTWDGKAVKAQVVEGTRPWGDISPYLDGAVRKHLVPGAYR